jgi:transposase InsO family protein
LHQDLVSPPVHLRLRGPLPENAVKRALRATLDTAHLLGLALGVHLRRLRAQGDPLADALSRLREADLRTRLAWETVEILGARLDRIPERRRPYYTPSHRFRVLEIKSLLGWNQDQTAKLFRVCANTIANWEAHADPASRTVGSTVTPVPPITRFADVVRASIERLGRFGFGGQDLIALTLARAGWRVSARSVARLRRRRPNQPVPPPPIPTRPSRPVVARFVHHVWMMDVTIIRSFLGGDIHLAGVFDAFSRVPIALQSFDRKPGAAAMARLLKSAVRVFGRPRYLITDLGSEFTGKVFRRIAARLGIVQRFASRENLYATARLERFWRTLKDTARLRLQAPLTICDLERRLEVALAHYLCHRPHQGLAGATPAEAFLGTPSIHLLAISPPRGRPGEGPDRPPFTIDFLDRARGAFPFLKQAA